MKNIIDELKVIYPQLPQGLLLRLIEQLENVVNLNSKTLQIKPPEGNNHYFSLCYKRKREVIIAGTTTSNSSNKKVPAIRFRNNNFILASIPEEFKFPYQERRPSWIYVEIRKETIDKFYALVATEVIYYLCHLTSRSS